MAALYGRLQGSRGEATRIGSASSGIKAVLETWEGRVRVDLQANGGFELSMATKDGRWVLVGQGNVNTQRFGLYYRDRMTEVIDTSS